MYYDLWGNDLVLPKNQKHNFPNSSMPPSICQDRIQPWFTQFYDEEQQI